MFVELKDAGPLDGSVGRAARGGGGDQPADMDGYWLREVRLRVGPRIPIVGTLDLHANLSAGMVVATDALIGTARIRTSINDNRGIEAGPAGRSHVARRSAPDSVGRVSAAGDQHRTSGHRTFRRAVSASKPSDDMLADNRVLSISFLLGFPYADVREMAQRAGRDRTTIP